MTVHQFFCILHFCNTCSLCRVELVVQFPARGSTQVLLCLFPVVLWLWHFLYSVGPLPVSSLRIYTFVVSRTFMAGAASQAGDADSSRAPGLISGLQGSVNVHRGALLLVPQWQCISSCVFYIEPAGKPTGRSSSFPEMKCLECVHTEMIYEMSWRMFANKVIFTFMRDRDFCWGLLLCDQVPLNRGINYTELLYLSSNLYDAKH